MLAALSIRDIVLIDKLDLAFGAGLSALTGETGAGKSILLDAFSLAIGARGDASLVRRGAEQGQVTATFELAPDHPILALLAGNDIALEDALILRRVQGADGRSRAFINDTSVSVQLLRQVGQALVEIHGQHDERALIDPSGHRDLVDAFGGLSGDAKQVEALYDAWLVADAARGRHESEIAATRANADYVAHALEELRALNPEAGEEEALAEKRQLMMNAEKIAADLNEALDALQGEGTAGARLASALRRIERQAASGGALLTGVAEALERVMTETNTARDKLEEALAAIAFEPVDLERAEERLFGLRALARKHRVPVDGLPALTARLEAELAALDTSEGRAAELAEQAKAARKAYEAAALALSKARAKAAKKLDAEVANELAPLKLDKARFVTHIDTVDMAEGGPSGIDRVAFWVATNPGTEPGPMMKVASGGELAALHPGAESGAGRARLRADPHLRRGGFRRRRRHGLGDRRAPGRACRQSPGAGRDSRAASGRARRRASDDRQGGDARAGRRDHGDPRGGPRRPAPARGDRRMLAGQTITDEARAAADRLMSKSA